MSFFTVIGGERLMYVIANLERGVAEMPALIEQGLTQTGEQTVSGLKDASPVGTGRTGGHLEDSFSARPIGAMALSVLTDQGEKLRWVTQGTTTPILPIHAKYLYSPELPHPMIWVRGQEANDFVAAVLSQTSYFMDEMQLVAQQIALIMEGK